MQYYVLTGAEADNDEQHLKHSTSQCTCRNTSSLDFGTAGSLEITKTPGGGGGDSTGGEDALGVAVGKGTMIVGASDGTATGSRGGIAGGDGLTSGGARGKRAGDGGWWRPDNL